MCYLETKIWVSGLLIATKVSWLPDSPVDRAQDTSTYEHLYTLIYICVYFYISPHVLKTTSSHGCLQNLNATGFILDFSLSVFVTPVTNSRKPTRLHSIGR